MFWIHFATLVCGGALAASGFIIAKKPEAKQLLDKLAPYQGLIGVAMLGMGVLNIFEGALGGAFRLMNVSVLLGATMLSVVICEVLVGFLLGFGLIATWIPGEVSAEKKGVELQQKLVNYQAPLGCVAIVTAVLLLMYRLNIL